MWGNQTGPGQCPRWRVWVRGGGGGGEEELSLRWAGPRGGRSMCRGPCGGAGEPAHQGGVCSYKWPPNLEGAGKECPSQATHSASSWKPGGQLPAAGTAPPGRAGGGRGRTGPHCARPWEPGKQEARVCPGRALGSEEPIERRQEEAGLYEGRPPARAEATLGHPSAAFRRLRPRGAAHSQSADRRSESHV